MGESEILRCVEKFFRLQEEDPHHSNKSWEHCYLFFQKYAKMGESEQGALLETACLHLGFFLASWGMYRGSTFVIWKDYKIFEGVLEALTDSEFRELWNARFYKDLLCSNAVITAKNKEIERVFALSRIIKESLEPHSTISKLNGERKTLRVTDTLVTKIMLGTMGCVAAYDTYFKKGLSELNIEGHTSFKKSFASVLEFCRGHLDEIEEVRRRIPELSYYPLVKIVDMYFVVRGLEAAGKA